MELSTESFWSQGFLTDSHPMMFHLRLGSCQRTLAVVCPSYMSVVTSQESIGLTLTRLQMIYPEWLTLLWNQTENFHEKCRSKPSLRMFTVARSVSIGLRVEVGA